MWASISGKLRDPETMPGGLKAVIRQEDWKPEPCRYALEITTKEGTISVRDLGFEDWRMA